jgi:tRNA(Ile)-lysidine synthase
LQLRQQAISVEQVEATEQLPLKLNRRVLQTAPLALQRRVIRQLLQHALNTAPSFEQIEKLAALITAPNGAQTDPFPGGAIALVDKEWIWLKHC